MGQIVMPFSSVHFVKTRTTTTKLNLFTNTKDKVPKQNKSNVVYEQPRPQGHLCGHGEEIDDPGKGCPNLLVRWLTHSTSQGL